MDTYVKRLVDLATEAENTVILPLAQEHNEIVFIDTDDDEVWGSDLFYELPVRAEVSKHYFHEEYAMVAVRMCPDANSMVEIHIAGRGDTEGDYWIPISHLTCEEIIILADHLNKILGPEKETT